MKEIKISNGYTTLVDDDDFEKLNKIKWQSLVKSNTIYACNNIGRMHRIIMDAKKGEIIDHLDGNGLNNQKSNLRNCTFQENMRNKRTWGKIKYNGVSFNKKTKNFPFRCRITINKKSIHLGYFKTAELAAKEYNKNALLYFGEYAKLNIL